MKKVLLIFGPSGSGKTTIARELVKKFNFLHYDIDPFYPTGDPIDNYHLRQEWNLYFDQGNPEALIEILNRRANEQNKDGIVLSFPSFILTPYLFSIAFQVGLKSIILFGSKDECLNAFLKREEQNERFLPPIHWEINNNHFYDAMCNSEYDKYRVLTFEKGNRRTMDEILKEIFEKHLQ